jgi:hypothetical protein
MLQASGAKARSKALGLMISAKLLKAIVIVLDLSASRRRYVMLHKYSVYTQPCIIHCEHVIAPASTSHHVMKTFLIHGLVYVCRQNTEVLLHYLDKIEGSWKPVCGASGPVVEKNTAKQDLPPVSNPNYMYA